MDFETIIPMALMMNDKVRESVAKTDEGYPLIVTDRSVMGRYPLIVVNQISGGDVLMADNEIFVERAMYQVSYYCANNEYVAVREEISNALRDIGFRVLHRYVTKSPYTNITNSIMHVRAIMQQEYYDKIRERVVKDYEQMFGEEDLTIPSGIYFKEDEQKDYRIGANEVYDLDQLGTDEVIFFD